MVVAPDIQRATEDEGEAQHVVDLVRVVRTAGGDDRVVAHGLDFLGRISGVGLASAMISGASRHLRHHLRLEHAAGGQAEEDVGAVDHLGQRARVGLLGVAGLDRSISFDAPS
jgi:hypothetical protein